MKLQPLRALGWGGGSAKTGAGQRPARARGSIQQLARALRAARCQRATRRAPRKLASVVEDGDTHDAIVAGDALQRLFDVRHAYPASALMLMTARWLTNHELTNHELTNHELQNFIHFG